jgi:tRNA-dihydrouridine synthase C
MASMSWLAATQIGAGVADGATGPAPLPFTGPWMLAPMEGVTESCFRDLVIRHNRAEDLGGACTEFVRVVDVPTPARVLRRHLGPERFRTPVALQLMGSDLDALGETARRAAAVGAPIIDLNFGCPSKGALRGCAGSALLDDPSSVERLVRAVRRAIPTTPLTAKIRAGGADDSLLEDLARAAEAGGAQMLTVHCRTRAEGYRDTADWRRLARAVSAVSIPVCGNGGISTHADLERMRAETGCRYGMVGRGALADPWIFTGHRATRDEALHFLLAYADLLAERAPRAPRAVAAKLKQLFCHWRAGDLITDATRAAWLRRPTSEALLEHLHALRATSEPSHDHAGGMDTAQSTPRTQLLEATA